MSQTAKDRKIEALSVELWNAVVPVGTQVIVERDGGERDGGERETRRTRSEAWVLSGHTAVIMLEGISGCYRLDRCLVPDSVGRRVA